jgi:hypothetical protein
MRDFVVDQIEIIDHEEYNNLMSKYSIGDHIELLNNYGQKEKYWLDVGSYKILLKEVTTGEFRSKPREFSFWCKFSDNNIIYETFDSEFEAHTRSSEFLNDYKGVTTNLGHRELEKDELKRGWVIKWYDSLDKFLKEHPECV